MTNALEHRCIEFISYLTKGFLLWGQVTGTFRMHLLSQFILCGKEAWMAYHIRLGSAPRKEGFQNLAFVIFTHCVAPCLFPRVHYGCLVMVWQILRLSAKYLLNKHLRWVRFWCFKNNFLVSLFQLYSHIHNKIYCTRIYADNLRLLTHSCLAGDSFQKGYSVIVH